MEDMSTYTITQPRTMHALDRDARVLTSMCSCGTIIAIDHRGDHFRERNAHISMHERAAWAAHQTKEETAMSTPDQCIALDNPGRWPYAVRCSNEARDGLHTCAAHAAWEEHA